LYEILIANFEVVNFEIRVVILRIGNLLKENGREGKIYDTWNTNGIKICKNVKEHVEISE